MEAAIFLAVACSVVTGACGVWAGFHLGREQAEEDERLRQIRERFNRRNG